MSLFSVSYATNQQSCHFANISCHRYRWEELPLQNGKWGFTIWLGQARKRDRPYDVYDHKDGFFVSYTIKPLPSGVEHPINPRFPSVKENVLERALSALLHDIPNRIDPLNKDRMPILFSFKPDRIEYTADLVES